MGLMYILPVSEDEIDRVTINNGEITLKTYGLPMVFWGYLGAILTVILAMGIAIKGPMLKLYQTNDTLNKALVVAVALTITIIPLATVISFFYEKFITKKDNELTITHRFFWLPVKTSKYALQSKDAIEIIHHMESPNIAKLKNEPSLRGFQNKGYFQLFARKSDGSYLFLDRSSRKADLTKIQELLSRY